MEFRKFSSIENTTRTKTVNHIIESVLSNGEWVQTLKIHGANYGIYCDGKDVKTAKRSGFIEGKSFYGDYNFDYTHNIKEMFLFLNDRIPGYTVSQISVHGEIYGGLYNHPDVKRDPSATRVQKEVQYRPDNDFIVFGITINGAFCSYYDKLDLCDMFGFRHVPVLSVGKFEDLINNPVTFPDPLHKEFDLPEIEGNMAEGWVLEPIVPKYFNNGSRVILKGKNDKFKETNEKKPRKPIVILSDYGNVMLAEILSYLTENRLRNVLSHGEIETVTQKDFGKLLGLFCQDAFGDFSKAFGREYEELPKKERHVIKKNMHRMAGDVIRPHFVNIIDGEF